MNVRNLKRLTAIVIAVALVLTSMTVVFSADAPTIANADKAVTLKDLGLYAGQAEDDPTKGLENRLTTQDSLILLAKLFGYSDTANKLKADEVTGALAKFDDAASISDYAKNVVAYSAANGILSGSTKGGQLFVGAKDTVTAARFATFMLKQMGHSVDDYRKSVAQLAETKGSKVDAALTGDLTRDTAVGVMYGALTAENASGRPVIADIVVDNADLKAKAEKLGLLTETSQDKTGDSEEISIGSGSGGSGSGGSGSGGSGSGDSGSGGNDANELRVVSIKALNNKQVEIGFNLQLDRDSAQNKENYLVKERGYINKTLTNTSCKLGDDMKTVTITLDNTVQDCFANETLTRVTLSKEIMATNGRKLGATKEIAADMRDHIEPVVKEVKATGERSIQITFSEPVYEGNNNTKTLSISNFDVKCGTYTYDVETAELDLNVINLNLGTNLIEGTNTVKVNYEGINVENAIKDYAGHKVLQREHTFDYVNDTSVVTVKSAKAKRVVLNFSKPVKGKNIKLYHTTISAVNMAEATSTDYVDEISFTFNNTLPGGEGIPLFLVNSEALEEEIIDKFGIKVPDMSLSCNVTIDITDPNVISCEANKDESIKIQFDEELDEEVATNSDSYVVKELSNNKEVPFEAVIDDSLKSVELQFKTKLVDNTEYQLIIKKYQDVYKNANESEHTWKFTTGDNKYPEVIENSCYAEAENGKIFIVYSEPMTQNQMIYKDNYRVSIDGGKEYKELGAEDTITQVNDRKIQIYVKELEGKKDSTIKPYVAISSPNVTDLAAKGLYHKTETHTIESIDSEVLIEGAQLIAKNKIKVIFNKKMGSVIWSDIELTNVTTPSSIAVINCESNTENSDGKTEVVLILDKDLTYHEEICITTIAAPTSESESGTKLKAQFSRYLIDMTDPEFES